MARNLGAVHGVRGPNCGSPSKASSHSSGGGGPTSLCHKARHCACRKRSCAAGPPRNAVIHLRVPTSTPPGPWASGSHSGSGTSPGAGSPPARIH
eukprot:9950947-Lingulodinium_polyedra.AAC.1